MDGENVALVLGGLGSVLAVVLPALRKRQDVDVDELRERVSDLSTRLAKAEEENGHLRAELIRLEALVFSLRRLLAAHGITEPAP